MDLPPLAVDGVSIVARPALSDAALNALMTAARPGHAPRAYGHLLARSLGYCGAYADGALVGFVNVAWDGDEHAFLLDPTVHPAHRRRGIGLALARAATRLAAEGGAKWLHVDHEPHLAGFYREAGFRPTEAGLIRLKPAAPAERPFERIHTVLEWWDEPRFGVADFDGAPHVYRALFREDLDEWDPDHRCELSPLPPEAFALALEDWEIWCRWELAYRAGRTSKDTHPVLPEDAGRHREIAAILEPALRIDPARRRVAAADFRPLGGRWHPPGIPSCWTAYEVRWTPDP